MSAIAITLDRIIGDLPDGLREREASDRDRLLHHVEMIRRAVPEGGTILDLGGGISALALMLAEHGYRVILVDDFRDPDNFAFPVETLPHGQHESIEIMNCDASAGDFVPPGDLDAVVTFDSLEHWHRSPKSALRKLAWALKPGGTMIIGMPNCVHARRRLTVPFGIGKWSSMESWYEQPEFRSHVREIDVADLRYIARDLQLENVRIHGRNWFGTQSPNPVKRVLSRIIDPLLRLRPSLCSNLYLLGTTPASR